MSKVLLIAISMKILLRFLLPLLLARLRREFGVAALMSGSGSAAYGASGAMAGAGVTVPISVNASF